MVNDDVVRYALMLQMPMYFNALVIEKTSRCNAQCAMCYQSAGPRGSDPIGLASLSVDEIAQIVRDAIRIPNLQRRVHLTGGEAFLQIEECITLFGIARDAGFLNLSSTTNAYWAKDPRRALDVCGRLREAGVTSLEISWDFWHRPFVPSDAVSNCLDACRETGIETNLRVLSTKTHSFDEAAGDLRPESVERADRITCGPVFPTGRASHTLERSDLFMQGTLDDNCHTYLNLTINARGAVYPCCAGIDQTTNYLFGNVRQAPITTIAASMNRSAMLRTIVFGGIRMLVPIIRDAGIAFDEDFNSICHMCWSIFSRPDCVDAIRTHFSRLQAESIRTAAAQLSQSLA